MKTKLSLLAFVLFFTLLLVSCGDKRPPSTLPSEGELGYIPISADVINISLSSPQAFVYDVKNNEFLYLKGEDDILYPASTTKLLTILYAETLLAPDELITPGDELSLMKENSTIAYIKSHHTLTVEMLIEGMLLPSGNDAAYALAAAAGKKLSDDPEISGVDAVLLFISGMNEFAASLGLCGSSFTSPDGYFSENHYTTVTDMALIAREAYKDELIRKYSSLPSDNVVYASGHTNTWTNTNLCLLESSEFYSPLVNGLKTGSAGRGNYSLIASFSCENGDFIIGLFSGENENDRFRDALKIINEITK